MYFFYITLMNIKGSHTPLTVSVYETMHSFKYRFIKFYTC